jgi:hypothetical protein
MNYASSKLKVNKFTPIKFATCKFSTWTLFKNRPLVAWSMHIVVSFPLTKINREF